jgi:thiol-disulfide isomerase/thioredoxin
VVTPNENAVVSTNATNVNKPPKTVYSRKNKLWLKITAPIVATVLLVTALVYYNFIDKPETLPTGAEVVQVGDEVPVFKLELYNVPTATLTATETGVNYSFTAKFDGELKIDINKNNVSAYKNGDMVTTLTVTKGETVDLTFKSSAETEFTVNFISYFDTTKLNGKVTVINFWQVTCDPCVKEIPHFEELYDFYNGQINMIAINDDDDYSRRRIQSFIENKGWGDYDMQFGRCLPDDVFNAFKVLGGKNAYPITVVVDTNGKIFNITQGSLTYDALKLILDNAMAN